MERIQTLSNLIITLPLTWSRSYKIIPNSQDWFFGGGRRDLRKIVDVILRASHKCLIYSWLFPLIIILLMCILIQCFPGSSVVKNPPAQCMRHGVGPWVRKMTWRRKWQPTPVSSPRKSHGQRRLAVHWVTKESDTT